MQTPPLVQRALAVAAPAPDGPLLHVLAGRRGVVRAAVVGPRACVRAAWVAAALAPGTPLLVVDEDAAHTRTTAAVLACDPDARVLTGDWRAVLPAEAPFDVLAAEAAAVGDAGAEVVALLAPGGTLVVAGLAAAGADATARLSHPLLAATEVLTAPSNASLVGVRLR